MSKILISLIAIINIKTIFVQNENLLFTAKKFGLFLDDPNDPFFNDICLNLEILKKDVTLDYRRKYLFFPKQSGKELVFHTPIRNNSNECFYMNNSFNNVFGSISVILIILFVIQFFLITRILLCDSSDSIDNTPYNKFKKMKKHAKKLNDNKDKENNNKNINIVNDTKKSYIKFTSEEIKEIVEKENKIDENENTNTNLIYESTRPMFNKDNIIQENQIKENKEIINAEYQKDSKTIDKMNQNLNINILKEEQENRENKKQNNLDEVYIPREKSSDNYTFGFNFGTNLNINNNINIKNGKENEEIDENNLEKKGEKMKRIKQIYEEINPTKKNIIPKNTFNHSNSRDIMNNDTILFSSPEPEKKVYVKEEYFYFKYLLARIEDKRTLFQIYLDLLEQNQIIIKFFAVPFNIYEDRKLQAVYYLTKIYIYFLINCLLIKSSVINDIYDNKNNIILDLFRSFKATIITYFLCFFLYKLTNIKRTLIKRRYKLINLKIQNKFLNAEIIELTKKLCYKFLRHKILSLFSLVLLIITYSYYISFSFCKVYKNTQILLLKSIIFCIIYSQIIPFIVCWIPAYTRKKSLDLKSAKLYDLTKFIEIFFVP